VIVQRIALLLLAALALVLGINLISATSRFTNAYETYDTLYLELTSFNYTDPDTPVPTTFTIGNPTRNTIEVIEIELNLNAGIHRVGGGTNRVLDVLEPGETRGYPVELLIFDRDYITRRIEGEPEWRMRGRVMVSIDPAIEPVWIPFVVRYIPE
jgi:hypothetical protein